MSDLAALWLLALAPFANGAQDEPQHPRDLRIPTLPPYDPVPASKFDFESGLRLSIVHSDDLPLVDGVLIFDSGSIHDPAGEVGLAQLLAETLREGGSESLPGLEFDRWLVQHGATVTITAERELCRVDFSCLSEHLTTVLQRLAELLRDPALPQDVIDGTRARMISDLERGGDRLDRIADRLTLLIAYGSDSPYAAEPTRESLEAISRDDLSAFHRAHFGADRLLLGVTGDVDPEAFAAFAEASFSDWKSAGEREPISAPAFLEPRTRTVYLCDRPGVTQTELRLIGPGVRRLHPDYSALYTWSHAIGAGGSANRLMVRVRTELGLAYTVGALYRAGFGRAGRFESWCGTRNAAVGEALSAILTVLREGLAPLESEELEAVKKRMLNSQVFEVDEELEVLERSLLLDFHGYPADFWSSHSDRLRALDAAAIAEAVARHLDPDRLVLIAVGPALEIADELAKFGEVVRIDELGRPVPAGLPDEAERLLERLGGAELWRSVRAVHRSGTMQVPTGNGPLAVPREQWQAMDPGRSRTEVEVNGTRTAVVLTPEACFSRTATSIEDLPADQCSSRKVRADGNLYRLLYLLANQQVAAIHHDAARGLVVELETGLVCEIRTGDDGLPISLRTLHAGTEEFWEFLEWNREAEPPWFEKARERNRGLLVETETFELDPVFSAELFRDPRK